MFSLFTNINVKVEDTESKPNEDRQGNNNLWSFQECSNWKLRISIPVETISSIWTHLKVFCKNVAGEFVLHQLLMLSLWEVKIFIQKLPEMLKDALHFEPTEFNAKFVNDETFFQPTDWEEKAKYDVLWELSENARGKVCVTRRFFQDYPNRCYFTMKFLTRRTEKDSFRRKFFLSVRIGELQKLHRMSYEIFSVLNKVKNRKKSQSA